MAPDGDLRQEITECARHPDHRPPRSKAHLLSLFARRVAELHPMYRSHRLPAEYPPAPREPAPNVSKSPAPRVVVDVWCGLIDHMDRPGLDRFTRDIFRRFDHADLEPLKRAILRRREELGPR